MHFAQVSGDIVVAKDDGLAVNLVIVAPSGDPVWSGIDELTVVNDVPGGDIVLAGDSVELLPGTSRGGLQVGTIPVTIPNEATEFALKSVSLTLADGSGSTTYDVGDWHSARVEPDTSIRIVGEYPASMPECGKVAFNVQRDDGSDAEITGVRTDAPGLKVTEFEAHFDDSGNGEIVFELECDGSFDVFSFSPRLLVSQGGGEVEVPLDPILVGYLDMKEDVVQRIASR